MFCFFCTQHLTGWASNGKKLKVHPFNFANGKLPEVVFIPPPPQVWSIISEIMESINVEMLNLLLMASN